MWATYWWTEITVSGVKMHLFFGDDSSRNGDRYEMGRLEAFGGFHVPAERLGPLNDEIVEIRGDEGLPNDAELKWSPSEGNPLRNWEEERRRRLYCRVLQAVGDHDGTAIVAVVDTGRTTIEGADAMSWAVKFVFERFNTHLAKTGEWGIVVPDQPGGGRAQEYEFLEEFVDMVRGGTDFSPGDRILLNALPTPSRFIHHLQAADVITSVTSAMVAGYYRYADPVFDEIQPLMLENAMNHIGGTGLKLLPDELKNLYRWILDERAFTKARSGLGERLPRADLPYAERDEARN